MTVTLNDYLESPACSLPPVWHRARAPRPMPLERHPHAGVWEITPPPRKAADLRSTLRSLLSQPVAEQFSMIPEGREDRALSNNQLVLEIRLGILSSRAGLAVTEDFLDEVFRELTPGERFRHTEAVIALLFALRASQIKGYTGVLQTFANAKPAEIARISRYAARLLRADDVR